VVWTSSPTYPIAPLSKENPVIFVHGAARYENSLGIGLGGKAGGVGKGQLATKVFGDDLKVLEDKAQEIVKVMRQVKGIEDLDEYSVNK
jgi:hypothetical protein